jgi:hypothetical protein
MKNDFSGVYTWLGVMFVSLGLAYWASVPQNNQTGKSPTQNIDPNSIGNVELSLGGVTTVADKDVKDDRRWWIKTDVKPSPGLASGNLPESSSKFLASEKFADYLVLLGKLPAQREIGLIPEGSLSDFGFSNANNWLRIKSNKGELMGAFQIGKQPYGARSFYVMRNADRKIFLIGADLIDDLLKPEARFFERDISRISLQSAKKVRIVMSGNVKVFSKMANDNLGTSQWADESMQGQVLPAVGLWLEKFFEVRAAAYADDELMGKLSRLSPAVELSITDDKGRGEKFEIRSINLTGQTEFYVTSDFLSWQVKVATARAENLVRDLSPILRN